MKDALKNVPIMSLQTGSEIARTEDFIIDPRDLMIKAIYCKGARLDFYPAVLYIDDVREYGRIGIIVDSADKLMDPSELVRLQEILKFNFRLIGKKVIDERGRKLGTVSDYSIESQSYMVSKLVVAPPVLKILQSAEKLIDRNQIVEINEREIVVSAATIKEPARQRSVAPAIAENPFRKPQPAAGAAQSDIN